MLTVLKENICNIQIFDHIEDHGSKVDLSLLAQVKYVCVYWVAYIK